MNARPSGIVRASEAGLCLLPGLAPLLSRSPAWDAGGLLLLGLALLFWAGLYRKGGQAIFSLLPVGEGTGEGSFRLERALIVGLFAWLTFSAVASPDVWRGLGYVALLAGCLSCALLARGATATAPGQSRRLAEASVWGGSWVSLVGMAEYYGLWTPAQSYPGRVVAAFTNPNDLGIYLCVLLPGGVLLLLSDLGRGRKVAVMAGTALNYTCLLMSGSRGAWWAGLCAGGAVAVWGGGLKGALSRNWRWALALFAILAGITVLYSVPGPFKAPAAASIPDRFMSSGEIARPGEGVSGTSVGHRYLIWSAAGAMVTGHPLLGVGPGFFGAVYPGLRDRLLSETRAFDRLEPGMRQEDVRYAHNEYLQMGAEVGLPGLLLFGGVIGVWAARAWRQARKEEGDRLARLGLLAPVTAVLVNALVSYPLHVPAVAVLFWSFLGMGMGKETYPPDPLS